MGEMDSQIVAPRRPTRSRSLSYAGRAVFPKPGDSQLVWCNPSVPVHSSSLITLRAGENTASQLYGPCGGLQRDMEGNPLQPTLKIERQQRRFPNGVKYWDTTVRI